MKKLFQKALTLLLVLIISVSSGNVQAYAQKSSERNNLESVLENESNPFSVESKSDYWDGVTTEKTYEDEKYKIIFILDEYWNGGFNITVKIQNMSGAKIENWYMSFDFANSISNLWGAQINTSEKGMYVIKNAGFNQDIATDKAVEFGFSANEDFKGFPVECKLHGTKREVNRENYTVNYKLDSDWGEGFSGSITITNNSEHTIEDWELEFEFEGEITNIWNAIIVSNEGSHYVISNADYNADITFGQVISIGFCGGKGLTEAAPENMVLYSYGLGDVEDEDITVEIDYELDTDNDRVPDYIEEFFGMDINSSDSDNDGLSDYVEIYYTGTDPMCTDTDGNGTADGDEDADNDGLTNLEEISLQTDPSKVDTDGDLLSDYDEVKVYGTNPLIFDSDGDKVGDGKEISFATDPLVPNEFFNIHAVADGVDTVEVSVDMQLPADQVDTLEIRKYDDGFLFPEEMPGYIGGCYDFSVEGSFEKAKINFKFNKELLADGNFDPAIYYFDEKEQTLELLDTTLEENVASATTTHFSKYILINRKVYEDSFTWKDVWSTTGYKNVEVVLVIDDSGSLGGDYGYDNEKGVFIDGMDPEHKRLEVARNFIDAANPSSKIGIVKFDGVIDNISNGLIECNPKGKEKLKEYLQFTYVKNGEYNINGIFDSRGYTYMYGGIQEAMNQFSENLEDTLKVLVVFTDGQAHDVAKHSSVIAAANDNSVKIYTVGLGKNTTYFTNYLKPLAQNTGGAFYLASDTDELAGIYNDINEKIDIETDSDGDGITDYYEDNMVMFNGMKLELDKNNPDTDNDGVPDGEEVCELKYEYNADKTKVIVTGKVLSNPLEKDTDYDGRNDNIDKAPLSGKFVGTMYGYYEVKDAQYVFDFREFFSDKDYYDSSIGSSSLIFANTIYDEGAFQYSLGADGKIVNIEEMLRFHGFDNIVNYKLADDYTDDDISEIGLGVHEVTYNGETKKILAVVIRGTNGTIQEWSSNFDMGDPDSWDSTYHKGFYLTEERIRSYINDYVSRNISDTSNLIYWITGHSRGAALSNILAAKLIDDGKEVYAYTFATPSTTVSTSMKESKYNSIFNIVNPRDVVTYVPLSQWGFGKFGKDITLDIGSLGLEEMWCYRTGQSDYNALEKGLLNLALSRLASDCAPTWAEVFDYAGSQNISDEQYDEVSERAKKYCKIEERYSIIGKHKGYKLYPTLAFFFQLGAEALAGTPEEKENMQDIIKEFWNSRYTVTILSILLQVGMDSTVDLPKQVGEFLVGDGHAPATYYVLINDSFMGKIR